METVHPAARDEFCTSLCLAKEATTSRVVPATATEIKHGDSSGWPNVQSGISIPSKIPVQPTPLTTWQHLPTTYAWERFPQAENHADLET